MLRLRWRVPVPVLALVVTGSLLSYRAPVSSQQLRIARLKNSVEIIRDHWGVPHIYARTLTICSLRNAKSQHHRPEPAVSDRPLEGSCRISFARHNSSWVSADIDLYVRGGGLELFVLRLDFDPTHQPRIWHAQTLQNRSHYGRKAHLTRAA